MGRSPLPPRPPVHATTTYACGYCESRRPATARGRCHECGADKPPRRPDPIRRPPVERIG